MSSSAPLQLYEGARGVATRAWERLGEQVRETGQVVGEAWIKHKPVTLLGWTVSESVMIGRFLWARKAPTESKGQGREDGKKR